jgi:hypothetical protein
MSRSDCPKNVDFRRHLVYYFVGTFPTNPELLMDDEDTIEFSQEEINRWIAAVQEERKKIFGRFSLVRKVPSPDKKGMSTTEMAGYLNDCFEDWRGKAKSGLTKEEALRAKGIEPVMDMADTSKEASGKGSECQEC